MSDERFDHEDGEETYRWVRNGTVSIPAESDDKPVNQYHANICDALRSDEVLKRYQGESELVDKYKDGDPKAHAGDKKISMTSVPLTMIPLAGIPMEDGVIKYGKYNWLTQPDHSMDLMVYLNGILRHLLLLMAGQDFTSDSGIHHLTAIVAGASVASDALFFDKMKDTRIKLTETQLLKYEALINKQLPNWLDELNCKDTVK